MTADSGLTEHAINSAVLNGEWWEDVKLQLRTTDDSRIRDKRCTEAIHSVVQSNQWEVLKFLIETIKDHTVRDQCCREVIHSAVQNNQWEVLKFLIKSITDNNARDECCKTQFNSVATGGTLEVVQFVVQSITKKEVQEQSCKEAIRHAAVRGRLEIVIFLFGMISDSNIGSQSYYKDAISSAASEGYLEVLIYLTLKITDGKIRDRNCKDAINSVLQNGPLSESLFQNTIKFLLSETIADNENQNWLGTLRLETELISWLSQCAINGKTERLDGVLSYFKQSYIQLLSISISDGHVALARALIEKLETSQVNLTDSSGSTALMLAADAGHHELIQQLLLAKASVDAQDTQGRTALWQACQAGHVRAAKVLIDKGADANYRDHNGVSCVEIAKSYDHGDVLRLFQCGAESQATNFGSLSRNTYEEDLSDELHQFLNNAGFTEKRAKLIQHMADFLEGVSRVLTQEDRQMTGSYAEGWAHSLVQVNGRIGTNSDIDWTVMVAGQQFYLEGGCDGEQEDYKDAVKLKVSKGHAQVHAGSGSQPSATVRACGSRPAQDTCYAFKCCNWFGKDSRILKHICIRGHTHLVKATRPNSPNELRVSFSFCEKEIMRSLSTVQGQLFTVIKFIFKYLLPRILNTTGLKTYYSKTLIFFMLEKHGKDNKSVWQPQNLVTLVKESLDMMLEFIRTSSSTDECMPHFFMDDAPMYFKNAGIGGDFEHTKSRVREELRDLRSNIGFVVHQIRNHMRALESPNFYFHPFTLVPLTQPSETNQIRDGRFEKYSDVYSVVYQCISALQSDSESFTLRDKENLMTQLSLLQPLTWCKCAALCLTAMTHLKFGDKKEAVRQLMELSNYSVKSGFDPKEISHRFYHNSDPDWAWRFCFPSTHKPHFPFLPEFTQTLFTARLQQPASSHLYVSFRCLSWSLQAEKLPQHFTPPSKRRAWLKEVLEDPDLEELHTVAHYTDCREQLQMCLKLMRTIMDERRIVMEAQDEEKIDLVHKKVQSIESNTEENEN